MNQCLECPEQLTENNTCSCNASVCKKHCGCGQSCDLCDCKVEAEKDEDATDDDEME